MRYLSLLVIAGAWSLAGCHDTLPPATPYVPDSALAHHFDALSAQATAAGQPNRAAALDLALHSLADGTIPATLTFTTATNGGVAVDYNALSWSAARIVRLASRDSVADSLMVLVAWQGANADTILVLRQGDPRLSPQVQSELNTLGLSGHFVATDTIKADTLTSAALVTGNTVVVADTGLARSSFGAIGPLCVFVPVTSITDDNTSLLQCNRAILTWAFTLQFSPSLTLGMASNLADAVVVVPVS